MAEKNKFIEQHPAEPLLPLEDFEPEADLPPENIEPAQEVSAAELQRQKHRLFEEWSQFSGVEMPQDIDPDKLNDQELIKALYENLTAGVDRAISEIGFNIDQQQLELINQEQDIAKKIELQKQFIDGILKQTKSIAEGGLFNRGKEDTWAFFPKQILADRRLNCSGATLIVGRILEQAGFKTEHGLAAHHAISVVELSDGQKYYVDSRRNRDNIVALGQEERPIGNLTYRELDHPRVAYRKIIAVPRQWAEVEVIMGNYNSMRSEANKRQRNKAGHQEAIRLIGKMDSKMTDIDFSLLWDKMFPEMLKLHTENSDWTEEEKSVDAKHNFSDQVEKAVGAKFADLSQDQWVNITNELISNGQEILAFCQNLDYSVINELQSKLSPDAYRVVIVIRDTLESIRGQSQAAYEFALDELKAKVSQ
jgi:hypothetical protein